MEILRDANPDSMYRHSHCTASVYLEENSISWKASNRIKKLFSDELSILLQKLTSSRKLTLENLLPSLYHIANKWKHKYSVSAMKICFWQIAYHKTPLHHGITTKTGEKNMKSDVRVECHAQSQHRAGEAASENFMWTIFVTFLPDVKTFLCHFVNCLVALRM